MSVLKTIVRLLTFRLTRGEMLTFNRNHFIAGLMGTWIVGMGRYWDHENASLLPHLGIGSIIYIFILAGFIWLIVKPYFVDDWTYFRVVTFIGLTSFPAILYAIPLEKYYSIHLADSINVWFLGVVAVWRFCLLIYFLYRFTRLGGYIFAIALMPIVLIVSTLSVLNLDHVVFNFMAGIRHETPNDSSYLFLEFLTFISALFVVPLIILYVYGIHSRNQERTKKADLNVKVNNFIMSKK